MSGHAAMHATPHASCAAILASIASQAEHRGTCVAEHACCAARLASIALANGTVCQYIAAVLAMAARSSVVSSRGTMPKPVEAGAHCAYAVHDP